MTQEKPTKVVSIDAILKSTFGILQTLVIGLQGWMLVTILAHSDRITRVELKGEYQTARDLEMISALKEINVKQSLILENQSSMKVEVERLKTDVKSVQEKK